MARVHPRDLEPGDRFRHPAAHGLVVVARHPGVCYDDGRTLQVAVERYSVEGRPVDHLVLFWDEEVELLHPES